MYLRRSKIDIEKKTVELQLKGRIRERPYDIRMEYGPLKQRYCFKSINETFDLQ